jgi:hypothetical protein
VSFVTVTAGGFQALLKAYGAQVDYVAGTAAAVKVGAFVRGLREDDLFVEAQQRDSVAVLDAKEFTAKTGQATPRRLDKLTTATGRYTVEAWRAAPESGPAIFYKLLLRGGQQ